MITTDFKFVDTVLTAYRDIALTRLLEVLPVREPRKYLYDLLPSYPRRVGKGLRSALCLATCKAFGGTIEQALDSAVAIELFHNGFLIHDDIQDESLFRRGKSTFYKEHGVGVAINVGNAMNLLSLQLLMKNKDSLGPQLSWKIFAETSEMLRQTLEGQALEMGWIKENACDLSDEDYLRMALKKNILVYLHLSYSAGRFDCHLGQCQSGSLLSIGLVYGHCLSDSRRLTQPPGRLYRLRQRNQWRSDGRQTHLDADPFTQQLQ